MIHVPRSSNPARSYFCNSTTSRPIQEEKKKKKEKAWPSICKTSQPRLSQLAKVGENINSRQSQSEMAQNCAVWPNCERRSESRHNTAPPSPFFPGNIAHISACNIISPPASKQLALEQPGWMEGAILLRISPNIFPLPF